MSTEPSQRSDRARPRCIDRVVFVGKSKRKTGNTRHMLRALRRRVAAVRYLNIPRMKKLYFWTDYRRVVESKITRFRPDLVLIYSKDLPYEVLARIGRSIRTATFYPDVRIPLDPELIRHGRLVDFLFITNTRQIPELKALGVRRPVFCLQGCDRDDHRMVSTRNPKWASEVAFIGRPSTPYRVELLQEIHKRFHLKAWGGAWRELGLMNPKQNVYPREYAKICFAAAVMIGCDFSHDMDHNTSNRTWITLGCGGFLLTNYQRGLESMFTRGVHLEWYHSQEECLELIDYYLKHDTERRRIARQGYEFAHAHRTYDVVIEEILGRIEQEA
jgi:hypothetical protein